MIELQGIGKDFGDTAAVHDISLHIRKGELVSLLGPSGCGKTTTLRMVAGFEQPTRGRIVIDRRDVTALAPEKRGLSMVFQNYALFPHLDVFDNVAFGLRLRGRSSAQARPAVLDALRRVGLHDLHRRMPRELSGGQQQRVSLARALVVEPAVLLMDEPLSNLDLKLREQLRDEIRAIQRATGLTAIYVTHDQGEAMAMSDRVAVMRAGRIEQIGLPREIYERPATTFVARFIGQCNVIGGRYDAAARIFITRAGLRLPVAPPAPGTPDRAPAAGGGHALAIRPEAWRLGGQAASDAAGPRAFRCEGRVRVAVYLGDHAQLGIELPGENGSEPLAVRWPIERGQPVPAVGDALPLSVAAQDCVLVDAPHGSAV
jgi:ABC-type Fe3+/spermidine/putrescine transport system ATPase subunit